MDKISAYYSLAFPNVTYYPQTLSVTIGRRSARQGAGSSSDSMQVDIDLGPLKSVSRYHARIEWEDSEDRFVLVVLGRNGAWVDGIWSGSGSRVPLAARSQIQIATRIFHFILPPPPAPEDSPSPSSPSTTRHATPSIDVTSLSPPSSLPSPAAKPASLPVEPPPKEVAKPPQKVHGKKRKKRDSDPEPPPEVMPDRPTFTYAQLCYRAITSLNGKATLQEVCSWIAGQFEWYRYNKACGWESSVRHNLSGNRAFKKLERCAGERGKGFFWSVDPKFEHLFEGLDVKWGEASGGGKDGSKVKGKATKASAAPLEPPFKRSVKGETKSPLPPPLTSSPLPAVPANAGASSSTTVEATSKAPVPNSEPTERPTPSEIKIETETVAPPTEVPVDQVPVPVLQVDTVAMNAGVPSLPPDTIVPIVIGPPSSPPTQPTNPSASASSAEASAFDLSYPPIALKGDTIILNPAIFSTLTPEQLKELEALGARKAIEILQSYIVRFLKVKIKTEGSKGKGKKKSKSSKRADGTKPADASSSSRKTKAAPATGPFTTAPLSMRKAPSSATATTNQPAQTEGLTAPSDPGAQPSRTASPSVNGLQAAVAPLRISSPPPMAQLSDPADEIIDIMGDDSTSTEEPAAKRRKTEPLTT
ncbi:hypothetical protein SCHPADRAFT_915461 [Schizopora paradoxa]|uniref:Uncharacterized protein n=1 Tax=Schizopora paradoxa TaxID=27342 RepID=A0A0H2RLN2_9AGAM|nr:hypothetical protein SCHPADRAFT_915461 [Schizopora paradoxa]